MARLQAWLRGRPAVVLIIVQIAAITVVGGVTAVRFHIFAAVDELAHISFVQAVAQQGALPTLGKAYVSWQMEAIENDTYPRHSSVDPRHDGLEGESYEAFQPPLYYLAAAPAFLIASNYRDKIIAVRLFDLLLLLAAVAILGLLARAVTPCHWQGAYAIALSVLLWPGIVVRTITVSNAALELPLALLYVLVVWHATARRGPRLLLGAAVLLGLCLLTATTLIFLVPLLALPLAALVRERRDARALLAAGCALLIPLALLAPWVISNEMRYGALTAGTLAKRMQAPVVDPTGKLFGLSTVVSRLGLLDRAVLPQEWWPRYELGGLDVILRAPAFALLAATLAPLLRRPRLLRSAAAALLAAPILLGVATLASIVLAVDWPAFLPRYVNVTFPLMALFAAWAWAQGGVREGQLLAVAGASTVVVAGIWVYMAGAFYFTNVGAALGIH